MQAAHAITSGLAPTGMHDGFESARSRAARHFEMAEVRLGLPDARLHEIVLDMKVGVHVGVRG